MLFEVQGKEERQKGPEEGKVNYLPFLHTPYDAISHKERFYPHRKRVWVNAV